MSLGSVLAVDDNPDNLVLLSGILQRAGYEVRAANSGKRALPMVERLVPELILLDIDMPDMNGYELCRQLKTNPATASVPVIFVSALDDVADKVRAFELGGVDYVTKPFKEAEVLARVGAQLRLFRLQRELAERNGQLQALNDELSLQQNKTEEVFLAFSDFLPGTLLTEKYRLEGKIGIGGFGAVYRGRHLLLDRPVAIKVLRPSGEGEVMQERLRTEGMAACRVVHPNAVEVIDFGVARGMGFLAMELLSGHPLDVVLSRGRLPRERALGIIISVCEALGAAHAAGVLHRDIKPQNIFLHHEANCEIVKLVDFGIAKFMRDAPSTIGQGLTATGHVVGTPLYMAPERLTTASYDASSDVYSVGVMLFEMVSGKPLFRELSRGDISEMVMLHLLRKPQNVREAAPDVPEELERIVTAAVSVVPSERPTARELAQQLRDFLDTPG